MQLSAQSKDLHARRKNARKLPANAKRVEDRISDQKHKPIRAILRSAYGTYEVFTPPASMCHPEDALEDLYLQTNALALSMSALLRRITGLEALLGKHGIPIDQDTLDTAAKPMEEGVTPMSTLPVRPKGQKVGAAVPGNEAEVLDPEPQPLPPAPENVVSISANKRASNDPRGADPPRTRDAFHGQVVQTTVDKDFDDKLGHMVGHKFGWSKLEALGILGKEYNRRDQQCKKNHGVGYKKLRLRRLLHKRNAVGFRHLGHLWIPASECVSGFTEFARRTESESFKVKVSMLAHDTTGAQYAIQACIVGLIKNGQPITRQRRVTRKKDAFRSGQGAVGQAWYARQRANFSTMSAHSHPPRSVWNWGAKWSATKMVWRDRLDHLNRVIGFTQGAKGFDWFKRERAVAEFKHEMHRIAEGQAQAHATDVPMHVVIKPDSSVPLSHLIRAANKRGIGY